VFEAMSARIQELEDENALLKSMMAAPPSAAVLVPAGDSDPLDIQ
jgi:hypothetical protein